MTLIANRKTIIRGETSVCYQRRPLIVTLRPYSLEIREKGRRKSFAVDYESIFSLGAKKAAQAEREARKGKGG